MTANEVILAYSFGMRDFSDVYLRGADLRNADLRDADLRDADLRNAYLQGADLRNSDLRGTDLQNADLVNANLQGADLIAANLKGALFSSPTMFLLASWGVVSDWLCAALMRYDASNHDNPQIFIDWARGGECPYGDESYRRAASFKEKRELFSMDAPLLSARQLMQCLLFESCVYY